MLKFGSFIRKVRLSSNYTLKEVADQLGVKVSYLSDVEHGRKKPFAPDLLKKFSEFLNIDLQKLQDRAAKERKSIEFTLNHSKKLNDLAYALARTTEGDGDMELLKEEMKRFLEEED